MEIIIAIPEGRIAKFIREVMNNYPEYSSPSLVCFEYNYEECKYRFWDVEDENGDGSKVYHDVDYPSLRKGFEIFINLGLRQEFNASGWDPTDFFKDDWDDWGCDWDADVLDGLVQCAIFGEVIYG